MANWFSDLLRERQQNDKQALEETFSGIAGALNGRDAHFGSEGRTELTEGAITDILTYYGYKYGKSPKDITDLGEYLDYVFHPLGLMRRRIELKERWYRDASGPVLAFLKESEKPVAILPDTFGYHYTDPETGKTVRMNRKTEDRFKREGFCFYKPFPLKKVTAAGLLRFALQNCSRSELVMMAAIIALIALIGLIIPELISFCYSTLTTATSIRLLISTAIFYTSVKIASLLMNTAKMILNNRLTTHMRIQIQSASMMRILSLPVSFFHKYSSGELNERAGYITTLCEQLVSALMDTGITSVFSLIYIGSINRFAPALVIPSLVITVLTALTSLYTAKLQRMINTESMEVSSKESGIAYAIISGIQKIRLCGAENRAFNRWGSLYKKGLKLNYNPPALLKLSPVISLAISSIGTIVLYYFAVKSDVTSADYGAFMSAYGMISGAFMGLTGIAKTIATIRPSLDMVKPILETLPEVAENKPVLRSLKGRIELNHVSFRYNDNMPNVLDDLNLKINPGQYVAIVGRTGCGKSTLIRLLLGFETPQKGAVYYDDKNINGIDLRSLRRLIGVVLQDGKLCQGDIFSNIVLSAPWLTLDDAWKAAEIAGVADDIRAMPMGMQTVLSEGGGGISGGQRQRLLIARAVASKPKILIFDEATSALDNLTQKQVSDALDDLKCTRIVVAHRLSTIRHCDRIIYLEGGKIREDGTYDELIAKNGAFAALVERQRIELTETGRNKETEIPEEI